MGETENIIVLDTTDSCFNRAATKSVEQWQYRPKIIDGVPVKREGVITQIKFQLATGGRRPPPEERVRPNVRRKLLNAQRRLNRNEDIDEILADIESIEEEYGDTFSTVELQAFHQLRAQARIKSGDYRGALDDFQIVKRFPLYGDAAESIDILIAALEQEIVKESGEDSLQESENAPSEEEPVEGEPSSD